MIELFALEKHERSYILIDQLHQRNTDKPVSVHFSNHEDEKE